MTSLPNILPMYVISGWEKFYNPEVFSRQKQLFNTLPLPQPSREHFLGKHKEGIFKKSNQILKSNVLLILIIINFYYYIIIEIFKRLTSEDI